MPAPKRADIGLHNWRRQPHSAWAFQHVRELIPTASINAARVHARTAPPHNDNSPELTAGDLPGIDGDAFRTQARTASPHNELSNLTAGDLPGIDGDAFRALLQKSHTDCLRILHRGATVWQWVGAQCDVHAPHIVFSISKSITAMLAGILATRGDLDVDRNCAHYLPAAIGGAYEDARVRDLLDMTASVAFDESYLSAGREYQNYRQAAGWNPPRADAPTLAAYLHSLPKGARQHGEVFQYCSPNTDLLALIIEHIGGASFAELLSTLIWQPMNASNDGYVTVDRAGNARASAGICVTLADLATFGEMVRCGGCIGEKQIIAQSWIDDTRTNGNRDAWQRGNFSALLPQGAYRNQWYQSNNRAQCFMALGIHSQWLYINPQSEVVIAKMSSQDAAVDERIDARLMLAFAKLSGAFGG